MIYKDEDEGSNSKETNLVDPLIYIEKIDKCIEGEYVGRFKKRIIGI